MAELFVNQAKQYAETRPSYPQQLFQFIASKTPTRDLVWDVGTGSGQAARSLAGIYKKVTGTDTSLKQLELAPKLPNVSYHHTAPVMSGSELEETVSAQSTWCYTIPEVNDSVDSVLEQFHSIDSEPFWEPRLKLIDDKYRSIDFPFEAVEGADHTGPFKFVAEKLMDLDEYLTYLRSWSAYQTAKTKGVELPRDDMIGSFKRAWNEDGHDQKAVKFPIYLRIGKVGNA
ncbi:hypothetical protein DKX38_023674 [Salix brachista]|uniref:Methyltransferase type 11 domain-containing protein n=1 Tax=Salix brachista TaxID=2182728 RepID=A0A5N5JQI8_9ROSI|nr:hypothetical protein DKX38_023674 [Salix brachista]